MASTPRFKVGDKIVDFGQVYRVFKVKEKIVFFKPYFKNKLNNGMVCSIPIGNFTKTKMRKPIKKKELKLLMKRLGRKMRKDKLLETTLAKDLLNFNDPQKTVRVLRSLWREKVDDSINFTKSKKDAFELAIKRFAEEVAFLLDVSVEKSREKIETALNSAY